MMSLSDSILSGHGIYRPLCAGGETRTEDLQRIVDFLDRYCREHEILRCNTWAGKERPSVVSGNISAALP